MAWAASHIVEQIIGISIDEAHRQRESKCRWIENAYPLVRLGITREECLEKLAAWGLPDVPKSACAFCPYHSDGMWSDMKANDPEAWNDAVDIDRRLRQDGLLTVLRGVAFLHRQRIPLEDVNFKPPKKDKQSRLDFGRFGSQECEGMCGV